VLVARALVCCCFPRLTPTAHAHLFYDCPSGHDNVAFGIDGSGHVTFGDNWHFLLEGRVVSMRRRIVPVERPTGSIVSSGGGTVRVELPTGQIFMFDVAEAEEGASLYDNSRSPAAIASLLNMPQVEAEIRRKFSPVSPPQPPVGG